MGNPWTGLGMLENALPTANLPPSTLFPRAPSKGIVGVNETVWTDSVVFVVTEEGATEVVVVEEAEEAEVAAGRVGSEVVEEVGVTVGVGDAEVGWEWE